MRKYSDTKEVNDSLFEENESHINLKNNIYKEIENILQEKRNFVIQTLTRENFSFDILQEKENKGTSLNANNIQQILELIKQRKKKVELTKKYLEEKIS